MIYLKLAWRNMWRSRRRTLITLSSVFFAVLFAILMRVLMIGVFDRVIRDTVSLWCGYLQIHHSGYWDSKSIDSSFEESPSLTKILDQEKRISAWAPHLESFALASSGERTKGMLLMGIDPERENEISKLSQHLVSGAYLTKSDTAILLSEGLANYLRVKISDTIVLLGQGYQGNMAAAKYILKGIVKIGIPEMNKTMAWIPLRVSRDFLSTGNRLTSCSIMIADPGSLADLKQKIQFNLKGQSFEIMDWKDMNPGLDQVFQAKMAQNKIMSGVLYLVIAFGIFGSILMMLNERMHEFGILIAIGMKKGILGGIVVLEMGMMALAASLLGILASIPIVYYFYLHPIYLGGSMAKISEQFNFEPILQPNIDAYNFIVQGIIVMSITMVLSVYTLFKINRLKAITAINS